MGIEALTHRDDGTAIAVPESHEDWQQWVSAGRTRNWMLGDPLIDWLRLYGKDRDYIPKQELDSYVEELDFLNFIFERGQQFEAGILRLLGETYEVSQPRTAGRLRGWDTAAARRDVRSRYDSAGLS